MGREEERERREETEREKRRLKTRGLVKERRQAVRERVFETVSGAKEWAERT